MNLEDQVKALTEELQRLRADVGALMAVKPGSKSLTQSISIGAGGGSANVPAAYSGTEIVVIRGKQREIPYL